MADLGTLSWDEPTTSGGSLDSLSWDEPTGESGPYTQQQAQWEAQRLATGKRHQFDGPEKPLLNNHNISDFAGGIFTPNGREQTRDVAPGTMAALESPVVAFTGLGESAIDKADQEVRDAGGQVPFADSLPKVYGGLGRVVLAGAAAPLVEGARKVAEIAQNEPGTDPLSGKSLLRAGVTGGAIYGAGAIGGALTGKVLESTANTAARVAGAAVAQLPGDVAALESMKAADAYGRGEPVLDSLKPTVEDLPQLGMSVGAGIAGAARAFTSPMTAAPAEPHITDMSYEPPVDLGKLGTGTKEQRMAADENQIHLENNLLNSDQGAEVLHRQELTNELAAANAAGDTQRVEQINQQLDNLRSEKNLIITGTDGTAPPEPPKPELIDQMQSMADFHDARNTLDENRNMMDWVVKSDPYETIPTERAVIPNELPTGEGQGQAGRQEVVSPAPVAQASPAAPGANRGAVEDTGLSETGMPDYVQRQYERIHQGQQPEREGTLMNTFDKVMQHIFTKQEPIDKLSRLANEHIKASGGKEVVPGSNQYLNPSEDPAMTRRMLHGTVGVTEEALNGTGIRDFNSREVVAPSLKSILSQIPDKQAMKEFRAYALSRRDVEVLNSGRETGGNLQDAEKTVADYAGTVHEQAFNELHQWQDSLLQYAHDAGLLNEQKLSAFREAGKEYIPLYRLMYKGELPDKVMQAANGGVAGVRKLWHELKGSERKVLDPIESVMGNAFAIMKSAEKNRTMQNIVKLGELPGFDEFIRPVEASAPNSVKVMIDGEPQHFELDKDLLAAVTDMSDSERSVANKLLSVPANLLRSGQVLDPSFQIANVMRDSVQASVISKSGLKPFEGVARAMLMQLTSGGRDQYKSLLDEWKTSGAAQSIEQGYYYDMDKRSELARQDVNPSKMKKVMKVAGAPFGPLQKAAQVSEEVTRLGEYKRAKEYAVTAGLEPKDAEVYAQFQSRNLMDFAEGGKSTAFLKGPAAFFGSQLQGLRREAAALNFSRDPKGAAKATLKGLLYLTIPTVLNAINNRYNEEYQTANQAKKDLMWGIKLPGVKHTLWIPKPPGIIGWGFTVPFERAIAFTAQHDHQAFDHWLGSAAGNIPNPVPTGARLAAELPANYSFFQDSPIVPESLKNKPPDLQFDRGTSMLARKVGGAAGVSPMKVDYGIRGITGTLGQRAIRGFNVAGGVGVPGIDALIPRPEGESAPDRPALLQRFSEDPTKSGGEALRRFYDKRAVLSQEIERLKSGGNTDANVAMLKPMDEAARRLSELRKAMDDSRSDEERAGLRQAMISIASGFIDLPQIRPLPAGAAPR